MDLRPCPGDRPLRRPPAPLWGAGGGSRTGRDPRPPHPRRVVDRRRPGDARPRHVVLRRVPAPGRVRPVLVGRRPTTRNLHAGGGPLPGHSGPGVLRSALAALRGRRGPLVSGSIGPLAGIARAPKLTPGYPNRELGMKVFVATRAGAEPGDFSQTIEGELVRLPITCDDPTCD